jgi:hypothetical protein
MTPTATLLAYAMRDARPDRGNKFASRTVQTKGEAAFKQWEHDVKTVADTLEEVGDFDRARWLSIATGETPRPAKT